MPSGWFLFPIRAITPDPAVGSANENINGATILATSCSSNWPAESVDTPSCLNTKGRPERLYIQNGTDTDT